MTFDVLTGWGIDATPEHYRWCNPRPGAVTWHYPEPPDDVYTSGPNECDLLDSGQCYGDTGFLIADTPWRLLREDGEDAMWAYLATLLPGMEAEDGQ